MSNMCRLVVWLCLPLGLFPIGETGARGAVEAGYSGVAGPMQVTGYPGWDIYAPPTWEDWGYRYGPSIIINADGSIDAWFSSPPGGEGWDWIRHKRSTDGGLTWGLERAVLKPTPGSSDWLSCCDPGVIQFGGHYYIGYTSVDNVEGVHNNVFVARSTSATGPFEKWNGSGWGGDPQPFIVYAGPPDAWGSGEPSFVVKGGTLYIYYSWDNQTRVATAPASDPNWPGSLTHHGVAITRAAGEDSTDLKYIDALGKFIGVAVGSRFSESSYLHVWESANGLTFAPVDEVTDNLQIWAHNVGISGTPEGHVDLGDDNFIAYAYSKEGGVSWGYWHTHMNPICFSDSYWSLFDRDGDFEGWTLDHSLGNGTVAGGVLSCELTGSDPQMASGPVTLNSSNYNYLQLRMRNGTGGGQASFYWITDIDPAWSEGKSVYFPVVPNDVGLRDYVVGLSPNPTWAGRILQLRLDPSHDAESGHIDIDLVSLNPTGSPVGVDCSDGDADGYNLEGYACGPMDCNDSDPTVNPGQSEVPDNGVDDDCDGEIDEGGDCFIDAVSSSAGRLPLARRGRPALAPGTGPVGAGHSGQRV